MLCLVFLVRIFYPTKIRTPYFARIFYPTKIRASYSVRIIFIRRILERSRFRPARISSVYVVPGTVSHVLPTFSILGALPAPLSSAPLRSKISDRLDYFPWLVVINPCTLSLGANDSIPVRKSTSRVTRREGGGRRRGARRLRSGNVKDTVALSM